MVFRRSRPPEYHGPWSAAVELAHRLQTGDCLPSLASQVLLGPGETLHASVGAGCWRRYGVNTMYEQRQVLAFGGLGMLGLTAAASAVGNRRRRAEARAYAVEQWRPLGELWVLATDRRLLLLHQNVWTSVWYSGIRQVLPCPHEWRMELMLEGDHPYGFQGEWVPYLSVVLVYLLWAEIVYLLPPG